MHERSAVTLGLCFSLRRTCSLHGLHSAILCLAMMRTQWLRVRFRHCAPVACDRDDPSNPMTEHWAEAWRQARRGFLLVCIYVYIYIYTHTCMYMHTV